MKILSIEDEPVVAERIERLCREILGDRLRQFDSFDHLEAAFEQAGSGIYDLFLLDLNLSGEDGFDLLRRSTSYSAQTIIISAYKNKAAQAFDCGVIDFVAKPFDRARLKLALDRFEQREKPAKELRFLNFRSSGRTEFVPIDQVVYVAGADKYAEVHFANGESKLHDKSLAALEQTLPPAFERIHKSYIVRWDCIAALHAREGSRYFVELNNGLMLPVSRLRYRELQARFR